VYVLYVFREDLSFSDLYDVYGQRALSSDVASGSLVGYATGILSGCMNPFLISIGLFGKRRTLIVLGLLGQIFIYSTFASKAVLISGFLIPVLYVLVFRSRSIDAWKLGSIACISIIIPLLLLALVEDIDSSAFVENVVALVFMRTYGMVGALTGIYHDFFSNNPITYFSHVNAVRLFIDYPYPTSIGETIGASMGLDMNANANFFATDGLESAGLPGVVVTGLFVGLILNLADKVIVPANVRLLCVASVPVAISLANSSMFTTLLTGGWIALIALCRVWDGSLNHRPSVRPSLAG
jgi:hypothetical protein